MVAALQRLKGKKIGRRLLAVGVLVAIAVFAVQGGEYGTFDIFSQKSRRDALQREVDALQQSVDSLLRWKAALARDPFVQERIAREQFGMVRGDKELLYRFIEPADTAR